MISSLAWVPAGVAAPHPKTYELSPAERELVALMERQGGIHDDHGPSGGDGDGPAAAKKARTPAVAAPPSDLPADLRMDEYSDEDEENDDGRGGMRLGRLLLGPGEDEEPDDSGGGGDDDDDDDDRGGSDAMEEHGRKESAYHTSNKHRGANHSDDDDSDDDLNDVPDTREYMPLDVEGLQAIGLSQVGGGYKDVQMDEIGEDDDESDAADVEISPTDALLVVGKAEDDFASLEVHVYDRKTGNLYVHHDIPLPAFPLCLAHGQVSSEGRTGNFCAVGTFHPGIEIWNLDVLNALEPSCVMGGEDTTLADDLMQAQALKGSPAAKAVRPRERGVRAGSHSDAVMALSWNSIHRQVIASGSADCTVKLWDVTKAGASSQQDCNAATFTHHKGKVQAVAWHPQEGTLLATGSYDRTVVLLDARGNGKEVKKVKLVADCEAICWDPHSPQYLTVASEDGTLTCWDVRQFTTDKPLWSFVANQFGITDISYNQRVPGFFATSSPDKTVTLWDASPPGSHNVQQRPKCCGSKDMCSGKLYTVQFYPSDPWLLGAGGSGNQLALWDFSNEREIQDRFAGRHQRSVTTTPNNEADFEAMMATKDTPSVDTPDTTKGERTKQKRSKKAHKRGR